MALRTTLPLPGGGPGAVAVPAPGVGPGFWAGAPVAVFDDAGAVLLGYRVRHGHDGHDEVVIARSADGARDFETLVALDERRFGATAVERPALVRRDDGGWRLYVCCATPGSRHWWIAALDAPTIAALDDAAVTTAFAGDQCTGVKDPIVRRTAAGGWQAWLCCHPLDVVDAEDRMSTSYATSADGLDWTLHGTVLGARPGRWDARGARLTAILPGGHAAYDGRATKEENWFERTGLATLDPATGIYVADDGGPVADVRYLEVLPLADGRARIYYEARLPDESHELRTELLPGA
jgi:hypothetical protein